MSNLVVPEFTTLNGVIEAPETSGDILVNGRGQR